MGSDNDVKCLIQSGADSRCKCTSPCQAQAEVNSRPAQAVVEMALLSVWLSGWLAGYLV